MEFAMSCRFSKIFVLVMSALLVACGESDNSTNNTIQAETAIPLPPKDKAINFYSADGEVIGTYMVKENGEIDKIMHPMAHSVVDMAYKELMKKYGDNLHREMLQVHTTVNLANQEYAMQAVNFRYYYCLKHGGRQCEMSANYNQPEGALVSVDANTGKVLALVGGRYDNSINRAIDTKRDVADLFQPFVYSLALESGYTPDSLISNKSILIDGKRYRSRKAWIAPKVESLKQMMQCSHNSVAVRMAEQLGLEKLQNYATRFGFAKDQLANDYGLAIGNATISPLELTTAYTVFANGGYKVTPYVIDKIYTANNELKEQTKPMTAKQDAPLAIETNNAKTINQMLLEVTNKGCSSTKEMKSFGRSDIAGISGLSASKQEAWFVGYNPNIVTVVYVGHDTTPHSLGEYAWGERVALPIWFDYMKFALKDVPQQPFEKPEPMNVPHKDFQEKTVFYDKTKPMVQEVILTPASNAMPPQSQPTLPKP